MQTCKACQGKRQIIVMGHDIICGPCDGKGEIKSPTKRFVNPKHLDNICFTKRMNELYK